MELASAERATVLDLSKTGVQCCGAMALDSGHFLPTGLRRQTAVFRRRLRPSRVLITAHEMAVYFLSGRIFLTSATIVSMSLSFNSPFLKAKLAFTVFLT